MSSNLISSVCEAEGSGKAARGDQRDLAARRRRKRSSGGEERVKEEPTEPESFFI